MIESIEELNSLIADCKFGNWEFRTGHMDDGYFLQMRFVAPCNITGKPEVQSCRKWYISQYSTNDEVIQTALLAVLKGVEHEAREQFQYKGKALFHTHLPVTMLLEIADHKSLRA